MTESFIELHSTTVIDDGERDLKGDADLGLYHALRDSATVFRAVAHNTDDRGATPSTLFHVDAPAGALNALVNAHTDHTDWGIGGGVYRGLYLQPGTPESNAAVDDLRDRIRAETGEDISTVDGERSVTDFADHPDATQPSPYSAVDFLKNDRPHRSPREDDDYRSPFDPTSWLLE